MRARAAAAAALASAGILAAGWQAGAQAIQAASVTGVAKTGTGTDTSGSAGTSGSSGTGAGSGTTGSSGSSGSSSGNGSSSGSQGSSSSAGLKNGTFTGPSESTRFGTVQVQAVVAGGKITDVKALHLTDAERRSQMISASAAPVLRSEVLQAQTANVDTVSGATITSEAYLSSLQGALDAARA
ncbi:MAG: FMN-binding protein [Sinomonas sp.]|nr:FMN-binding protein [Sinomonas sp.]